MGKALVDFSKSHYGTLVGIMVGALLYAIAQKYEWAAAIIGPTTMP